MGFYKEDWRPSSSKSGRWKENKTDGGGEPNHNYSDLACSFSCTLMTKRKVSLPLKHRKLIMQEDKVWRNRLANKMHALAARLNMKTGCLCLFLSWMVKDMTFEVMVGIFKLHIQFCPLHIHKLNGTNMAASPNWSFPLKCINIQFYFFVACVQEKNGKST